MHIINSPYNFSIQNCPQNNDRVQLRFQSPERCIIKLDGSYSLFQFERSDVISVLKNSIEYSFVFFKCLSSQNLSKDMLNPK